MKQILSIEELQDAVASGKEIYMVNNYVNSDKEIIFHKSFKIFYIQDHTDLNLRMWANSKTLFSTDTINLEIIDNKNL